MIAVRPAASSAWCVALVALAACEPAPSGTPASTSPTAEVATATPAPSEAPEAPEAATPASTGSGAGPAAEGMLLDPSGRLVPVDAGVASEPLARDQPLANDPLPSQSVGGVTLVGEFAWAEVPSAPKGAKAAASGLEAGKALTALTCNVELAKEGRMRLELASRAFPLPMRTEVRSRVDKLGHALVWPQALGYRVLPVGTLRRTLDERRVEPIALEPGVVATERGGGKRLGYTLTRRSVRTALGTVRLELAQVAEAGEGALLLCRALVELAGVEPRSPACAPGELVLAADYAWAAGGKLSFSASSVTQRADLAPGGFLVPPPGAAFQREALPGGMGDAFLTRDELAAFRAGPEPGLGPVTDASAPGEGVVLQSRAARPLYALLDGVPVALVPPGGEVYLVGTTRATYGVSFRSFLGDEVHAARAVALPARVVHPPSK